MSHRKGARRAKLEGIGGGLKATRFAGAECSSLGRDFEAEFGF